MSIFQANRNTRTAIPPGIERAPWSPDGVDGLIVGTTNDARRDLLLLRRDGAVPCVCVDGVPGSGKTTRYFQPNALNAIRRGRSVVLLAHDGSERAVVELARTEGYQVILWGQQDPAWHPLHTIFWLLHPGRAYFDPVKECIRIAECAVPILPDCAGCARRVMQRDVVAAALLAAKGPEDYLQLPHLLRGQNLARILLQAALDQPEDNHATQFLTMTAQSVVDGAISGSELDGAARLYEAVVLHGNMEFSPVPAATQSPDAILQNKGLLILPVCPTGGQLTHLIVARLLRELRYSQEPYHPVDFLLDNANLIDPIPKLDSVLAVGVGGKNCTVSLSVSDPSYPGIWDNIVSCADAMVTVEKNHAAKLTVNNRGMVEVVQTQLPAAIPPSRLET